MRRIFLLVCAFVFLGASAPETSKPVFKARVFEVREGKKGISQLEWETPEKDGSWVEVSPEPEQAPSKTKFRGKNLGVTLKFRYSRPYATLIFPQAPNAGSAEAPADDKPRSYSFFIPLESPLTRFPLMAVLPSGEIEEAEFLAEFPEWQKAQAYYSIKREPEVSPFRTETKSISLGYTSLLYQEHGIDPIQMGALTLKGGLSGDIQKLFSGKNGVSPWSWGLSGYFTAMQLSSTRPDATLRFLGINARVGYLVPFLRAPWSLRLMGGFYFTTTLVGTDDPLTVFGFKEQRGPQLQPLLTRSLGKDHQVSVYLKIASISDGLSIFDLSSREFAWGAGYSYSLRPGLSVTVSVDQGWLATIIEGSRITSDSLSLGAGLVFASE